MIEHVLISAAVVMCGVETLLQKAKWERAMALQRDEPGWCGS
jgi:xanthine/uracil permease